jgi:hypothetical protein
MKSLAPTPNVTLTMTPSTARVLVDGRVVGVSGGKIYVIPGKHSVQATQSGFSDYSETVEVNRNPKTLIIILNPIDEVGRKFLHFNPEEQRLRESIIGKLSASQNEDLANKNPITAILPYIDQYFRIDYGASQAHPEDSNAIAVYITSFAPDGKQRAVALLQTKGFDPSKLEIIYSAR